MGDTLVTVTAESLVIEPVGLDKVWSLTRRLRIPLDQVAGVGLDAGATAGPDGWRLPGLRVPGKVSGRFRSRGRTEFWNVSARERTVGITLLEPARYDRVVVDVDDPQGVVDRITDAVNARGPVTGDG